MPEKEMYKDDDKGWVWREFGKDIVVAFVVTIFFLVYLFGDDGLRLVLFLVSIYIAADNVVARILRRENG